VRFSICAVSLVSFAFFILGYFMTGASQSLESALRIFGFSIGCLHGDNTVSKRFPTQACLFELLVF